MQACLPTWEFGPMATEAVAPIVYTRLSLTNRLGGCLVTLCSWGAQRSSAHTPVSRSSSLPIFNPKKVTASLCSTTTSVVGEQAYSDHFGGHRATGQWTKQRTGNGTQHTLRRCPESLTDFARHHTGRTRQRRQVDTVHDSSMSRTREDSTV